MTDIKFLNLKMLNFKGIRSMSIEFSDLTNIYGRNETGKTTIVDAIMWVLFGKDHAYRTSFPIKTRNDDGEEIPHLEHSVELALLVNNVQRNIKRVLKEKWTKPRGQAEQVFSGNYQEIYVDGEPVLYGDYTQFIRSIIPEDVFMTITSPTFFHKIAWQEKRKFLQRMAGNITDEMITGGDEKYKPLLEALKKQTLQAYTKHLKYCISETKKQLNNIPIRISEQEKALPEKKGWHDVEQRLKDAQGRREQLMAERIEQATMTPAQRKRKELNDEISKLNGVLNERRSAVQAVYNSKIKEQQKRHEWACSEIETHQQTVIDSKCLINVLRDKISQQQDFLLKCEEDKKRIRKQWSEIPVRFEAPENVGVCSECGAVLSPEQVRKKTNKLRAAFNKNIADTKSSLRQEANDVKQRDDAARKDLSSYDDEIKKTQGVIDDVQAKIEELKKIPALPDDEINDLLIDDEKYVEADEKIHKLKEQLSSITDENVSSDAQKDDGLAELDTQIQELTRMLAEKIQYERIQQNIEDIKRENKDIAQHLASLEQEEDILTEYSLRADNLLEESVNKHFTLVKWKMFRTLVNGNKEPYCECTLKGVDATNGLNTAGYIMAGVDICNAISKFYGIVAPIIIDNAESINKKNFILSAGQQIRLFVSEDEKLTIR